MAHGQPNRFRRPKIAGAVLAVVALIGSAFLLAGPASAATPATAITPSSDTYTSGTANSTHITADGGPLASRIITCTHVGLFDCFNHAGGDGHGLTYATVGHDFEVFSDGTTPAGTYTMTLNVHTGAVAPGGLDALFTFTLTVVPAPVLSIGDTVHTVGVDTTTTLSSADGSVPTKITCPNCDTVLPSGLVFTDNGTGTPGTAQISGVPAVGTGGSYDVHIRQKGTDGSQVDQTVTITVQEGPHFTSAASATGRIGTAFTFGVTTSPAFPPGTTVSVTAGALPTGITFTPSGTGGTLSGTPTVFGEFHFTFTATNGIAALDATQSFTLDIDSPPVVVLSSGGTSYTVGQAHYFYVAVVDAFPDATLSASSAPGPALPSGLALYDYGLYAGAHYWYLAGTPAVGTGGAYTITFTASNGVSPDGVLNVPITINEAPFFAGATSATFVANQANTSAAVTISGGYPTPGFLTASGLPSWLTFHPASGTFTGTPSAADSGDYSITVTAHNGDDTVTRTEQFAIRVHAPAVTLPAAAPTSDGAIIGVQATTDQASCVTWSATGFAPFAPVTLAAYKVPAYSGKTSLGTFDADASGNVDLSTCLPGALLGAKYLVAGGYQTSGAIAYLTAQTTIKAPVHFGH